MRVLGIETSCDDTCISIYDDKKGIILNTNINQNKIHHKYDGIVPNLASDKHINNIYKIFKKNKINFKKISLIAYTNGPGLFGSLITGVYIGKSLAYSLNIPSIPINHIEAHMISPMINNKNIKFPLIGLIISGGHTELIRSYKIGKYKIIGKTLDNSLGQTFDKVAKILNIKFPGSKIISKISKYGKLGKYKFPKPLINSKDLNFSFSGLKTHIYYLIKNNKNITIQDRFDISREFENSIINILINKSIKALNKYKINTLLISGGVSKNENIIKSLRKNINKKINIYYPKKKIRTDNSIMIAYLGYIKFFKNKKEIYYKYLNNLSIIINSKCSINNI
ncbi:tRNA (adenosine(37)-N6)-threonylcarbamoyltransferase complex transferase subunit TsaD [Candidatus Nardonella dryophthoridicola]|nr:tRNA (adenosine(37)-N6)-threonylcarbamoyltransferase complex transferase subunit TsaD [Candidatus Nardonella dryophthoridicola]